MPTSSPSPTEPKSLKCIKDTSFSNSHPNRSQNTFASLLSTKPLENEFQSDVTCSYPTLSSSATSAPCTLTISGPLNPLDCPDLLLRHHQTDHPLGCVTKPAITGTKEYAGKEKTAFTSTSANCVLRRDIPVTSARRKALQEVLELKARCPGWVRNLMWNDLDLGISRAATWTEYSEPLPSVPSDEFRNVEALSTISNFPHLFKIVTPINACRLKHLLAYHPNQLFVDSVIQGFSVGFWPYAHTYYGTYPTMSMTQEIHPKLLNKLSFYASRY